MLRTYINVTLIVDLGAEAVLDMYRPGASTTARPTRRPITATSKSPKQLNPLNFETSNDSLSQHRRVTTSARRQKIRSEYLTNHTSDASPNKVRHMKNQRAHRPLPATAPHIDDNSFTQGIPACQ